MQLDKQLIFMAYKYVPPIYYLAQLLGGSSL